MAALANLWKHIAYWAVLFVSNAATIRTWPITRNVSDPVRNRAIRSQDKSFCGRRHYPRRMANGSTEGARLENGSSAATATRRGNLDVEHYPKAPIIEAILDIQVKPSAPTSQDVFTQLGGTLAAEYPQSANLNINQLRVGITVAPVAATAPSIAHSVTTSGLRLLRPNERVLIVQPRGMTFSHMPPYTSWEIFETEARRLWERYVAFVKPESVIRVALRYVNRIDVPGQRFELSDYFKLYPEIPKAIPQDMNAMFMQIQMPQSDVAPDMMAAINFATAGRINEHTSSMILDIDLFAVRTLTTSSEEVFKVFDQIRTRKNELFEAFITEKTRELFRQ